MIMTQPYEVFTATATSIVSNINAAQATTYVRGNGAGNNHYTHMQICELPSNYIETTEF